MWEVFSALGRDQGLFVFPADYPYLDVQAWVEKYKQGTWPLFDLPAPSSGNTEVDELLMRIVELHRAIVAVSREVGPKRSDLNNHAQPSREMGLEIIGGSIELNDDVAGFLKNFHSDHWCASVATRAFYCADQVRADPSSAPSVVKALREVLDNPHPEERPVPDVVSELEELLQLPVWKHRYELYSVWVFCSMSEVIDKISTVEYQFTDGFFDIPFTPKRLAVLQGVEPPVYLWSEVRTQLDQPRGKSRKHGMQPDFMLAVDPEDPPSTAFGVVECKQYRTPKASNFSDALSDYAKGQPEAQVVLINYGPAPDSILTYVPEAFRSQVSIIGEMRPDQGEALYRWRRWLDELLRSHCDVIPTSLCGIGDELAFVEGFLGAQCQLSWGASPRDLDLHVQTPVWLANKHISYNQKGTIADAPWVELDEDITDGHGPETIRFGKAVRGRYRVAVHQYSDDGRLADSNAKVLVELPGSSKGEFGCPGEGEGDWWYVCDLDFESNLVIPINRISSKSPIEPKTESS